MLPAMPGAYLLLVRLDAPRTVRLPRGAHRLGPGWLAYAGSARGSGGIAARAARHLREGNPMRWHIDRLTACTATVGALAFPGGAECTLVDRLRAHPRVHAPAPGFGSSDCPDCTAHLVALPLPADAPPDEADALARALAGPAAAVLWKGAERPMTGSE